MIEALGAQLRVSKYTYTAQGLTNDVIDPRGHRTVFGYTTGAIAGLVNSVTEKAVETWVDSTGFTADDAFAVLDLIHQFNHDAKGNDSTSTTPGKVVTAYVRDAHGRVTEVYDPLGFRQTWQYAARGTPRDLRVHRGLVQLRPAALDAQLRQSRAVRA